MKTSDPSGNALLAPFRVLGLPVGASQSEVRARYLELIKRFPPEREPEKFQQIQAAFKAAEDPLVLARSLLVPPDPDDAPTWDSVIQRHSKRPPAMQVDFLLSLGNQTGSGKRLRLDAAHDTTDPNGNDISNSSVDADAAGGLTDGEMSRGEADG